MYTHKTISKNLEAWYLENARDLPWRKTKDPYKIWLSEIILQQTTIAQGLEYYKRFVAKYPDVFALAKATEEEVLKMWEGLGYYSRARNLHFTAQYICRELDGVFPNNYKDLLSLKGVGPYTAAAIASFAFNESTAVVDGNVVRWVARFFGIEDPVDQPKVLAQIQQHAQEMISHINPYLFNQSSMEFGALCCSYRSPSCESCPLNGSCLSLKSNTVRSSPKKSKKIKKKQRHFRYYHIIDSHGNTVIQKRTENDIWKGLFQFPLMESFSKEDFENESVSCLNIPASHFSYINIFQQILTHQKINGAFYRANIKNCATLSLSENHFIIPHDKIREYPFPKIMDLYLSDISIPLF